MSETLVLTSAEIDFLLRARPQAPAPVRAQLNLGDDPAIAAAGLSSLLARGLCVRDGDTVAPTDTVVAAIACLSTAELAVRTMGWIDGATALVHLFSGPVGRIALINAGYGQYTVRLLSREVALADQLTAFVNSCLADARQTSVLIQATSSSTTVSAAVAVDAAGAWHLSDSVDSPDRSRPSTPDEAAAAIATLLDRIPA